MSTRSLALKGGLCLVSALCGMGSAPSSPELRSMSLESSAVARTMRYDVLLPAGYESSEERYPVLYLLHGVNGDYRSWSEKNGILERSRELGSWIVVMPDAGNSWYVNWAAAEDPAANRWEDYLVRDLIPEVDARFRTQPRREGRAIAGLSMGGYGALVVGLRNPHLFASVGSSSGYLDYARGFVRQLEEGEARPPRRRALTRRALGPQPGEQPLTARPAGFRSQAERSPEGAAFSDLEGARRHDPFGLVLELPRAELPHLVLDCGTEDLLMPFTRELAETLLAEGIPFDYLQLPGGHDSAYWRRALGHTLPVHYEILRRGLAAAGDPVHGESR